MTSYRRLTLFVEGKDDIDFAEQILLPLAEHRYDYVDIYEYAQKTRSNTREFITTIVRADYWDYLFMADFDQGPCVTRRKDQLVSRYGNLEPDRILIVRREIESWYLAGLDRDSCAELGIPFLGDTDDVTKEQFDGMIPNSFDARTDFMVEILNRFSTETARGRNGSFDYAMGKHFRPIA